MLHVLVILMTRYCNLNSKRQSIKLRSFPVDFFYGQRKGGDLTFNTCQHVESHEICGIFISERIFLNYEIVKVLSILNCLIFGAWVRLEKKLLDLGVDNCVDLFRTLLGAKNLINVSFTSTFRLIIDIMDWSRSWQEEFVLTLHNFETAAPCHLSFALLAPFLCEALNGSFLLWVNLISEKFG